MDPKWTSGNELKYLKQVLDNAKEVRVNAQTMLREYKGRYVGVDADFAMFSLERTKHISSHEGGILITNNADYATKARKFAGGGFKNLTADKSKLAAKIPLEFQSPDYKRHDYLGLNYRISEFCAAVALAQFELVEEKVKIRRDIAKIYSELFSEFPEFEPQEVPTGYVHSYFTYSVKSPFKNLEDWKKFYTNHVKNGGDNFYAMMSPVYSEEIMKDLGYLDKNLKKCLITEEIQPRCMLFKTNYRSIDQAKKFIEKIKVSINTYKGLKG